MFPCPLVCAVKDGIHARRGRDLLLRSGQQVSKGHFFGQSAERPPGEQGEWHLSVRGCHRAEPRTHVNSDRMTELSRGVLVTGKMAF